MTTMDEDAQAGAVIYVEDVPRVARFYEALAAMHTVVAEADHHVLATAAVQLVVHAIPQNLRGAASADFTPREGGAVKLFFTVPSLAAVRERAPALGGRLQPQDKEWAWRGCRICDGVDPEGNVVQFREPLP